MPVLLHIGCGPKRKPQTTAGFQGSEWEELRYDIDPAVHPDILGTMTDMSALADASVDAIFSSHNLEHLYPYEVEIALREFSRVLRPEGFAVITCPDLQSIAALVAQDRLIEPAYLSGAGPISAIDMIYGHRPALAAGNHFMAHRCGFTLRVLMAVLQENGFAHTMGIARPRAFDLWTVASKSLEQTQMRDLAAAHFPATTA